MSKSASWTRRARRSPSACRRSPGAFPAGVQGLISAARTEQDDIFVDGWFRTEDIMRVDADGYYYLVDRKRDIVKTGGENVYAQEIERVLQSHPPSWTAPS